MKKVKGFTLIELMIVVAIIGILAAIAIPKFADLIRKANEGATKGSLSTVRSALSIYYADNEGAYPTNAENLTIGGKYIESMPMAYAAGYHGKLNTIALRPDMTTGLTDAGNWSYMFNATSMQTQGQGTFLVNCSHTDTKGSVWSQY